MEAMLWIYVIVTFSLDHINGDLWTKWWTYQGISGPDYWGLLNKEWSLCSRGKHQSPVDINPKTLVYDPNLKPLRLDKHRIDAALINTGHDILLEVNETYEMPFSFTGGPLSYKYKVHYLKLHFGRVDQIGSEHSVAGRPFPLEIQIYGYNHELYSNFSEAESMPHGIAALTVFGMVGDEKNTEFEILVQASTHTRLKGDVIELEGFSIFHLLPETEFFLTYEGSLTQPSCMETVTWVILNKPLYVTKEQLYILRDLNKAPETNHHVLMENNFRPPMPLNRRTIRTNIAPKKDEEKCGVKKITFYEVNNKYKVT